MADSNFTPEELANEVWRPIIGYETIYSVSNLGRIRRDAAAYGTHSGRIVQPSLNIDGYLRVSLSVKNIRRNYQVHHLVMHAFIGPRPSGLEINHCDGNKQNARIENLEYVTRQANHQHASKMGLVAKGIRHGSVTKPENLKRGQDVNTAKLTPDIVKSIRQRYAIGDTSQRKLAREFNVSQTAIRYILQRRNWKHI